MEVKMVRMFLTLSILCIGLSIECASWGQSIEGDHHSMMILYPHNMDCPAIYERIEGEELRIHPSPLSKRCWPRFVSDELSILSPECVYTLIVPDKGVKNFIYSERCVIELRKVNEEAI